MVDREAAVRAEIRRWAAEQAAKAPPMSEEQARRTSFLLFGSWPDDGDDLEPPVVTTTD
jgi:hypothetical protein